MDFRLDDQQLALQQAVADFGAARYPLDGIEARQADGRRSVVGDWAELCDLGIVSLLVAEADGGLGLGVVHATLVFEQLGRFLMPGPILWSTLAAAVLGDGSPRPRLISGWDAAGSDVVGSRAVGGDVAGSDPDEPGDAGEPILVDHAEDLEALLVLGRARVALVERADLPPPRPLDALDPLTPVGRYEHLPPGRVVGGGELAERLRRQGTVLTAALLVGVAQAALDLARDYSLEREQFGRPIGSFQALKHLMADMYVRIGLARSSTYAAAAVLDDPRVGDVARSVSGAKLLAGEAATDNARTAIQILGGMGFTWDMPTNHLLKRAWVLEQSFGSSTDHALAVSASLAGAGR